MLSIVYKEHCTKNNVHRASYVLQLDKILHNVQFSVQWTMYSAHCTIGEIHYTKGIVHCTLDTLHCTMDTLYKGHCTLYNGNCTLYNGNCTLYNGHSLYNRHCMLYIILWHLYIDCGTLNTGIYVLLEFLYTRTQFFQ